MLQNAKCHAISASAKTEFQPNQIGSKHCYTMNKGKMVIRTKNIANFQQYGREETMLSTLI